MFGLPDAQSRLVRWLIVVGVVAFAAAGFAALQIGQSSAGPPFHATAYPDSPLASDFTLTDHRGDETSLSDFRGFPVLLFFGFTQCPDVCPLTLSRLSQIVRSETGDAADTRILLVSVDPRNDTPERLREYVEGFGPSVTGFTGDASTINSVMADFGAYAQSSHSQGPEPAIVHTPAVFGIDRNGRIQVLIHADQSEDVVRDDIRTLASLN